MDSRRLRQRGGRAGGQVAVQPLDQLLAAGEVRVATGQVPDRWQGAREAGPLHDRPRIASRKRRDGRRLRPCLPHPGEETAGRFTLLDADQIEIGDGSKQPRRREVGDPHRQESIRTVLPRLGESCGPLLPAIGGGTIGRRQDSEGADRLLEGTVHVGDEILAHMKVPRLQHDGLPGLLQDPGDPLGPPAVGAGVA